MSYFSYTSSGPRNNNQDYFYVEEIDGLGTLYCVADGVGGNNGGEVASKFAIENFILNLKELNGSLYEAMYKTHQSLIIKASTTPELEGMATTFTALLISQNNLTGVHTGDSRAYILRRNGIKQLTRDHTEVAKLVEENQITKEQAINYPRKNVLYSALGSQKELIIDKFEFELEKNDRVLLLTDGFYSKISKLIFRDLSLSSKTINELGEKSVLFVQNSKPDDNYTILALEVS